MRMTDEELDNLPFNPGWWGKQLETRDQITMHEEQQSFQPMHTEYPTLFQSSGFDFKSAFTQKASEIQQSALENPELDEVF